MSLEGQTDFPLVTIIVPAYNARRTIRACVESLLAQEYPRDRYEVIVVDNNSTDGSDEIVHEYPVTLLYERDIQTSYAARNRGIRHARGEIVAFTDADCVADTNWLSELVKPFDDPSVVGVGGQVLNVEPANDVERFVASMGLFSRYQQEDSYLPVLLAGSTAYLRDRLLEVGLFNANLFTGADVDLSWRIQQIPGNRVAYAPNAIVYHKHRSTLKSMARQFRRHGFGEILLDAMYKECEGYRRTPRRQLARIGRQCLALLTYVRSLVYRSMVWKIRNEDRMYVLSPFFWLVAEGNNVYGKLQALWATRFFRLNPSTWVWQNRWER